MTFQEKLFLLQQEVVTHMFFEKNRLWKITVCVCPSVRKAWSPEALMARAGRRPGGVGGVSHARARTALAESRTVTPSGWRRGHESAAKSSPECRRSPGDPSPLRRAPPVPAGFLSCRVPSGSTGSLAPVRGAAAVSCISAPLVAPPWSRTRRPSRCAFAQEPRGWRSRRGLRAVLRAVLPQVLQRFRSGSVGGSAGTCTERGSVRSRTF